MVQLRFALLMGTLGTLGAALSLAFLLVIPTDAGRGGYTQLIGENLPVLVFTAAAGFGMGVLMAVVWSLLQRLFATDLPRA